MTAGERLNIFWPCCLLLVCGFAGIAAPQVLPAAGERVAVVAPGADAVRIVARAGGNALTTTDTGVIAVSNDPEFVAKAAEVVGLYINPPGKAIVFCVDESPRSRRWSGRKDI